MFQAIMVRQTSAAINWKNISAYERTQSEKMEAFISKHISCIGFSPRLGNCTLSNERTETETETHSICD